MKSTTAANAHSQVRKAISQLYEYRYIQQAPNARLVVIENPVPKNKRWLIDYVVDDRQLLIAWDGDRQQTSIAPIGSGENSDFWCSRSPGRWLRFKGLNSARIQGEPNPRKLTL